MKYQFLILIFSIVCVPISFGNTIPNKTKTTNNYKDYSQEENIYVIIDKSDYELNIYDEEGWLESYPVVFGIKNQGDKMYEGDRKTPNGNFTLIEKREHTKWTRFMLLDYPTQVDKDLFAERKRKGLIPKNAKIGSGIGIHGTTAGNDYLINTYKNWTNGCISLRTGDIITLFEKLPIGTRVSIQP
jgi:murein L,D-transpeptidase YafK